MIGTIAAIAAGAVGLAIHENCADARARMAARNSGGGGHSVIDYSESIEEGFGNVAAAIREGNEMRGFKISIPLAAYRRYREHAAAWDDLVHVWHALHSIRERLYYEIARDWTGTGREHSFSSVREYFEVKYIMEVIDSSIKDSPLFADTVESAAAGDGMVELRGPKAEAYLNQKCVILHIDDLMELIGRCRKPWFNLAEKVGKYLYSPLGPSPARKAGPLKYMEVSFDHSCFEPLFSVYGVLDGEDKRVYLTDEVENMAKAISPTHCKGWL